MVEVPSTTRLAPGMGLRLVDASSGPRSAYRTDYGRASAREPRDDHERDEGDMADSTEQNGPDEPGADAPMPAATDGATSKSLMSAAALVPDWLINLAAMGWRVLVIAALVLVSLYLASLLWTVVGGVILAIIVAAAFAPLVLKLRDGGKTRTAAAGIAWLASLGVLVGVILLLVLAVMPVIAELVPKIQAGISELQASLDDAQAPAFVGAVAGDAGETISSTVADTVSGIVGSAASVVTILILAIFLVFYFLRDGDKAWLWIFQAVSDQKRDLITTAGDAALTRVGGYLRTTTARSALVAITDLVFMLVLGVPFALPLAVIVFFGGFIPYFGGLVTAAIILLATLSELGSIAVVVMLVLFVGRDVALRYLLKPVVSGRTVDIHPALVMVVVLAGYELAGVVGLVAAVPVTAVILATARAVTEIIQPDPAPELPGLVPAWLDRTAQYSWRILVGLGFVALLIAILIAVPLVLVPIIIALIAAATLEPLAEMLIKRGQPRARASVIVVAGSFFAIAAVLALAMGALVEQGAEIGDTATSGADSANETLGGHLDIPSEAVSVGADTAVGAIVSFGQSFGAIIVIAIVSTLLTLYFLRDGGQLWSGLVGRLGSDVRDDVRAAGSRAFDVLGGYMIGTAAISFVGAGSQWVIMVVLGLPLALPVFVLSFILGFIPYIGGFISTGIAFLIAVAVGSTVDVVIMFLWTILFNLVAGNVVSPIVYGKTVHIHPAIVLVAIPAGSAIAGIMGMFIVVPALGVVAVSWRTVLKVMGSHGPVVDSAREPPNPPLVEAIDST